MVRMPRSARPAAMRSPMRLTNFTGVESWSGIGFDGSSGGSAKEVGWAQEQKQIRGRNDRKEGKGKNGRQQVRSLRSE